VKNEKRREEMKRGCLGRRMVCGEEKRMASGEEGEEGEEGEGGCCVVCVGEEGEEGEWG